MNNIEKLSDKLYTKYYQGVPWDRLTDEEACMSIGKAITKVLNQIVATEKENLIAPVRGMNTAKKEALIRLSVDIANRGIELMLKKERSN
jgi:hypothetical protein